MHELLQSKIGIRPNANTCHLCGQPHDRTELIHAAEREREHNWHTTGTKACMRCVRDVRRLRAQRALLRIMNGVRCGRTLATASNTREPIIWCIIASMFTEPINISTRQQVERCFWFLEWRLQLFGTCLHAYSFLVFSISVHSSIYCPLTFSVSSSPTKMANKTSIKKYVPFGCESASDIPFFVHFNRISTFHTTTTLCDDIK